VTKALVPETKAEAPELEAEAMKMLLEATSRRGSVSRHHVTEYNIIIGLQHG